jgi:hypothetical protein
VSLAIESGIARRHNRAVSALKHLFGECPTEAGRAAGDEPDGFSLLAETLSFVDILLSH